MYITRALIGRNPCLDEVIQTRVKKSAQNHPPSARRLVISRDFLNSRNIPACLDHAIQTRKP
jgi:hypothetical protein